MGISLSRRALLLAILFIAASAPAISEPSPAATAAFNAYIGALESRLARQHSSAATYIVPVNPAQQNQLHQGQLIIDRINPQPDAHPPGALIHHWRGTAFAPGARATDFERVLRDINHYPQYFAPQILQARLLSQQDDHLQVSMRVRQHHVFTVVLDTTYDVTRGQLDPQHGFSNSRSTQISEIASPGTPSEHALKPEDDHGFLWRLNTYWTYEERDGGLYMQIETVSLTRSIPAALAWVIKPYIESVPRDSMEFTLRATRDALQQPAHASMR
jgi:hypothetical protein